jgi:hypothetical protein
MNAAMRTGLWAVADAGLFHLDVTAEIAKAELRLVEEHLNCIAVNPTEGGRIYVGMRAGGVLRSPDYGNTWRDLHLPETDVYALAVAPLDGCLYAGTEPSKLFKSTDDGETWREMAALRQLPSAPSWSFPPRPWTSHVRWIAPNPADADLLLVGIELGGVMRSSDGGESWEDHRPGAQKDCHALAWHPVETQRAYEAGGGGTAWSRDGGATWTPADEGRDQHYTWALAVDPEDPDRWFVSASSGPGRAHSNGDAQAFIHRWEGKGPWQKTGREPLSSMPYALCFTRDRLFAGLRDGRLLASDDRGETWVRIRVEGPPLAGLRTLNAA